MMEFLRREAHAGVDNAKAQRATTGDKSHPGLFGVAVLDDIPQRFLSDSVQAQGRVGMNGLGHIRMLKMDADALRITDFPAESRPGRPRAPPAPESTV